MQPEHFDRSEKEEELSLSHLLSLQVTQTVAQGKQDPLVNPQKIFSGNRKYNKECSWYIPWAGSVPF